MTRIGRRARALLMGALLPVSLLLALEMAVNRGVLPRPLIPAPSDVWAELVYLFGEAEVWGPLGETLLLLAAAYFLASGLAVGVGLLMGRSRAVYNLLEPLTEALRPLPKPALLPPLILFLGLGDAMKITIVGLAVFFPVLINTVQGIRSVDPILIDLSRTLGKGHWRQTFHVLLPSALPHIMAGMRISLGLGLILVVVAEMLAGTGGLGYLIVDMQRTFRITSMYAWIVILAVVGVLLNSVFERLEQRLLFWNRSG